MPYNNSPGNPCRHLKAMIYWIPPSFWLPSLSRSYYGCLATALLLGILRSESLYHYIIRTCVARCMMNELPLLIEPKVII